MKRGKLVVFLLELRKGLCSTGRRWELCLFCVQDGEAAPRDKSTREYWILDSVLKPVNTSDKIF